LSWIARKHSRSAAGQSHSKRRCRHGADESGSGAQGGRLGEARCPGQEASETEVEHLGAPARRDDDVARLYVAMDDALLMRRLQGIGDIERDGPRPGLGKRPVREDPGQRFAGHVLEHEKVDRAVGVEVEKRRDVGVEESRQGARFEPEPPLRSLVLKRVLLQDLDRHVTLEPRIFGAKNDSHAAFSEAVDDPIPAERLTDHRASWGECENDYATSRPRHETGQASGRPGGGAFEDGWRRPA
jgi:hypothetical protein